MLFLTPVGVVTLVWTLHAGSNPERIRTGIELRVGERRVRVGTVRSGCQAEAAEIDPPAPGKDGLVSRLTCYIAGYGTYVDAILTAKDRLTIRRWGQAEPLEGRPDPPVENRRTVATVAVPAGARFAIKVVDQ
jgi:hypothetical protein